MKTKVVEFTRSPSGSPFRLGYFVGDVVELEEKQAQTLIDAKFAKEHRPSIKKVSTDLPGDIPGRYNLLKAGVKTMEELTAYQDLTDISGIGNKLAEKIKDFLKG